MENVLFVPKRTPPVAEVPQLCYVPMVAPLASFSDPGPRYKLPPLPPTFGHACD